MLNTSLQQARILIVDDEKANVRLLEVILQQAGYTDVHTTDDARQALPLFCSIQPDIVLLDLSMPHLDGFAVMAQLQPEMNGSPIPILVLTADSTSASKHKALHEGASDFLTKPLDKIEVLLRLNNLLESRFHNVLLEEKVRERTRDLEKAQLEIVARMTQLDEAQTEMLSRLAQAAEYRDDETGHHTHRVGHIAALVAGQMGLSAYQVDLIRRAAPLHDVGKIGIPDSILLKPGALTDEEFDTMKTHTTIGMTLLRDGNSALMRLAKQIALCHHERWDGSGYPHGLKGEAIPRGGRIVSIADVFDALTHERPYKKAWPVREALIEIESQSGRQFDPRVVEAFLQVHAKGAIRDAELLIAPTG